MTEEHVETIPLRGGQLVDQLMAEQDDVMRRLDELDAQIVSLIAQIVQERQDSDRSAA
jgi:hypothetical protein